MDIYKFKGKEFGLMKDKFLEMGVEWKKIEKNIDLKRNRFIFVVFYFFVRDC